MATLKVSKNTLTKNPPLYRGVDILDIVRSNKNPQKPVMDILDSNFCWSQTALGQDSNEK